MYTTYAYTFIYTYSFICICIYVYVLYTNIFIMRYIKLDLKINKSISHYIIHFTFDIDFLKNLINLILFYVFNLTVLYIFHLYLFVGLFVYYI